MKGETHGTLNIATIAYSMNTSPPDDKYKLLHVICIPSGLIKNVDHSQFYANTRKRCKKITHSSSIGVQADAENIII
jgi:hypothetical protein